jgi:hypothetical protein
MFDFRIGRIPMMKTWKQLFAMKDLIDSSHDFFDQTPMTL